MPIGYFIALTPKSKYFIIFIFRGSRLTAPFRCKSYKTTSPSIKTIKWLLLGTRVTKQLPRYKSYKTATPRYKSCKITAPMDIKAIK